MHPFHDTIFKTNYVRSPEHTTLCFLTVSAHMWRICPRERSMRSMRQHQDEKHAPSQRKGGLYVWGEGFWAGPSARVRPELYDHGDNTVNLTSSTEREAVVEALPGKLEAESIALVSGHGIPLMACGPRHGLLAPGRSSGASSKPRGMLAFGENVHGQLGLGHYERRSVPCTK